MIKDGRIHTIATQNNFTTHVTELLNPNNIHSVFGGCLYIGAKQGIGIFQSVDEICTYLQLGYYEAEPSNLIETIQLINEEPFNECYRVLIIDATATTDLDMDVVHKLVGKRSHPYCNLEVQSDLAIIVINYTKLDYEYEHLYTAIVDIV